LKIKSGHIINIGSLAGREVYEKGNIYCATKHAVNAISKAMRIDLNKTGIKVSEINPGLVETDFSNVRFKGIVIGQKRFIKDIRRYRLMILLIL
jgi:NADP-dependent 3-hydroxy acid dehydrogenase YdfG